MTTGPARTARMPRPLRASGSSLRCGRDKKGEEGTRGGLQVPSPHDSVLPPPQPQGTFRFGKRKDVERRAALAGAKVGSLPSVSHQVMTTLRRRVLTARPAVAFFPTPGGLRREPQHGSAGHWWCCRSRGLQGAKGQGARCVHVAQWPPPAPRACVLRASTAPQHSPPYQEPR